MKTFENSFLYNTLLFIYTLIIVFSTLTFIRLTMTFPVIALGNRYTHDPEVHPNIFFYNLSSFLSLNFLFTFQNIGILIFILLRFLPLGAFLEEELVDKFKSLWNITLTWWAAIFTIVSAISIVGVG